MNKELTPLRIVKSEEEINEIYRQHLDCDLPPYISNKYTGHGVYERAVEENKKIINLTKNLLKEKKQTYLHRYFRKSLIEGVWTHFFVKDIRLNVEKETIIFGDKPSIEWIKEYGFSFLVEYWHFDSERISGEYILYYFTGESRLLNCEEINQAEWLKNKLSLLDIESDGLTPSIGQVERGTNEQEN